MEQSADEREVEVASCGVDGGGAKTPGELGSGRTAEQFR